jgi:RNA polymerase sigma-70 factor (ECF subfamily)
MNGQDDELIPTRASLLARLKDWQDRSSWQEFFNIYWKLIYGVARKAGLNDEEAQDVVQETMTSVSKHMPTFNYDPAIGSFKAWLLKLTRWRILDAFRKRSLVKADLQRFDSTTTGTSMVEKVPDPASLKLDELWEVDWQRTLLNAAIAKVKQRVDPEKYQIFDLYVNKEVAAEKVASCFAVSVDQVYLAKHRVTEMIKAEVKRLEKEIT